MVPSVKVALGLGTLDHAHVPCGHTVQAFGKLRSVHGSVIIEVNRLPLGVNARIGSTRPLNLRFGLGNLGQSGVSLSCQSGRIPDGQIG